MACNCRGNRTGVSRTVSSADFSRMRYEVWQVKPDGTAVYSQRRFTSLIAAKSYADRIGGEVREAQP